MSCLSACDCHYFRDVILSVINRPSCFAAGLGLPSYALTTATAVGFRYCETGKIVLFNRRLRSKTSGWYFGGLEQISPFASTSSR